MTYKVKLSPKVLKKLRKLDFSISSRILSKLMKLKLDPFRFLEHLEGIDCYKLRIGDYRCLVDVYFEEKIVYVQILDHRKRLYKRK